ncbi:MAG: DUF3299 domain-containing protein [Bauldia sp.]
MSAKRFLVSVAAVGLAAAGLALVAQSSGLLSGLFGVRVVDGRLVYPAAALVDWSDLIPADAGGSVRTADGAVPRGLVQHGELLPGGPVAPGADAPLPDIAAALGAFNDLGGAPRRLADSFGGLGNLKALQAGGGATRAELDGREIRMAGFVAPLAFSGDKITSFLLVPYVGACIHVPPPPANQIVLVSKVAGFRPDNDLLYPVWVTGRLRAEAVDTDLARVGYQIEGAVVEPYREGG